MRRDEVGGELEDEGELLEDPAAHDPADDRDVPADRRVFAKSSTRLDSVVGDKIDEIMFPTLEA